MCSCITSLPSLQEENSPLESPENAGRNNGSAHLPEAEIETMIPHCQRDEAREPEERGDAIDDRICELEVPSAGEEARGEEEVDEGGEDGPDGGEEEKVCLGDGEKVVDDWRNKILLDWGSFWGDREGGKGGKGERTYCRQ